LATAVGSARLARIMAESRYRTLAGMDPDTISTTIDTTPNTQIGELNALRSTLAAAQTQYATLSVTLLGNNPEMVVLRGRIAELRKQLDTEQARVLSQAKENFKQAQAAENQTTAALLGQKSQADKLGDDLVEYTLRKREFEANSTLYDELRQRLRTSEVEAGLESAEIDVVDHAVPPAGPELQRLSTLILTSLVFSMLAGVVIAFLLESLDSGMRTIAEVEHVTGLPTLAILPREKKSGSPPKPGQSVANRNIDVLNMPKSQYAEAIRSLRTSLLLSTTDHPPKYMLFTSATPAEGKTTTVTNTACVLAQGGSRVLLVDADLRRPNVHHRFGISGRVGLSSVLTGASTLEEAAQSIPDVPGLDVLPSGPIPPFPTEMLGSQSMQKLLEQAGEIYDFILIDSPPVLSVTDSVVLAHRADAVVMIVRQGKVSKHGVRRGRDLLVRSGARMTGIILNAVDLNSPEYRGYYGYSGYSYSSVDNETWESEMSGTGESKKGEDA
jgi:succinoglycan biosynthesis transport protein ExoP